MKKVNPKSKKGIKIWTFINVHFWKIQNNVEKTRFFHFLTISITIIFWCLKKMWW